MNTVSSNMILENLTGLQKTAIVVIALGKDAAADLFKHFRDPDIERLAVEIAKLKDIPSNVVEAVIEEFYQMIMAQEYISQGGMDYAKTVLETALGKPKASEIVSRVEAAVHVSGFNLIKDVDPAQFIR